MSGSSSFDRSPVQRVLSALQNVRDTGDGWTATCPAHADDTPSLSVSRGRDGRVLVHCHAGCDFESIVSAIGLEPADLFGEGGNTATSGYTLESYASDKDLPIDFLRELGVRSHKRPGKPPCVAIPYFDEDGEFVTERFRTGERFWWPRGSELLPYGLDRLARTNPRRVLLLVEGESDAMTCWLHGIPALGIPGARAWRPSWARYLEGRRALAWMEPDAGGRTFIETLRGDLPDLRVLRPPEGVKDPSELHIKNPDGFNTMLADLFESAVPLSELPPVPEESEARENDSTRLARLVLLSTVKPERISWLWPGRVPLGKLTLFDGDPGLGKSTLALDLAARISEGREMPDGTESDLDGPAGTVLLTAEDGLADTVRPRLDAAESDCTRIVALRFVVNADGKQQLPTVRDIDAIEEAITLVGARLIVFDPLVAYLGKADSHKDQQVRAALADLADLADRTHAAVIAIRHLRKSSAEQAMYRGGGSIAMIAAARAAHLIAPDPDDPEERRILAPLKMNLARPSPSLAFVLHGLGDVARIVWQGESDHTAEDLLGSSRTRARPALEEAADFLRTALEQGPRPMRELLLEAQAMGIAEVTVRRAKSELGVESNKEDFEGGWTWELADEEDV